MATTPDQHKADAPDSVRCAVITLSDTRTVETDTGGQTVVDRLSAAGHEVAYRDIIPDEPEQLRCLLEQFRDQSDIDCVLLTGGTGISARDQTFETVSELLTRSLPG